MSCYHPIKAYPYGITKNGKQQLVFKAPSPGHQSIKVPCGQCIGCRLEKSRQWALRMTHEASLYEENSFITLTYDDEHRPEDYSLNKEHFKKFMKRLRQQAKRKYGKEKIRYFHCGEYGEESYREHYHAILFNFDFRDKTYYKTHNDNDLYTSDFLNSLWPFGHAIIGQFSFETAAYVARYVTKKITGKQAEANKAIHGLSPYHRVNALTGELTEVIPEYATMSLKPGIGKKWYETYQSDCYPSDFLVVNGVKMQPPKYYDSLYPDIQTIKDRRKQRAIQHESNNTPRRLRIRETIKMAQATQLKRNL